jgi:hypothetical protein
MQANPFEVLKLAPGASEEEIVRQAGRLRQRATDEAEVAAILQAVQALTGKPEERLLHALLTHPQPEYASAAIERLIAAYRRPPAATAQAAAPEVPFDAEEFYRLLLAQLLEELEPPAQAFEPVPRTEDAAEIRRQIAEALWQSLLHDPRA